MVQIVSAEASDSELAAVRHAPHSIEAEQSVLGGLLLDNNAWARIADLLGEGDFYSADHRTIYKHVVKLVDESRPADVITVAESLERNGELARVGGLCGPEVHAHHTVRGAEDDVVLHVIGRGGVDPAEPALGAEGRAEHRGQGA